MNKIKSIKIYQDGLSNNLCYENYNIDKIDYYFTSSPIISHQKEINSFIESINNSSSENLEIVISIITSFYLNVYIYNGFLNNVEFKDKYYLVVSDKCTTHNIIFNNNKTNIHFIMEDVHLFN